MDMSRVQSPRAVRKLVLILVLACAASFAHAHPHMFLKSSAEFVWDGDALSGCWLEWTFDEFFSADIIHGFDLNQDGKFSEQESRDVFAGAFSNLKNYYYFTFIREGSARSNPKEIQRFSAKQTDGKLSYRFFVDLSSTSGNELALAVYDYTFFCDISYTEKNPVVLTHGGEVSPRYEIRENRSFPVYYNPKGAIDDTTVYYEWKKGLMTYYPREIVLVW